MRTIVFAAALLLCVAAGPRAANADGGAPVIYSGTVTSNGAPAADFEVTLYQGDGLSPKFLSDRRFVVSTRTESDGAFVLVVPLEAVKDQVVTLRAKGYSPAANGTGKEFVGGQSVLTGDANAVAGVAITANAAVDFNYGIRNNRYARKSLFYVTDRARVSRAVGVQFANTPADRFRPTFGSYVGAVALGPSASPSGTCDTSMGWKCPGDLVRQDDSYVDTVSALPAGADGEDAWIRAIAAALPATRRGRILFYVHGFNNDFATAGATLARLAYETGQKADAGVLYSWPSAHKTSKYMQDLKTVDVSVETNLVRILHKLAAIPNADVTIVGHSMGTFALTRALTQLAPQHASPFAMLALFAGDVDVNTFRPALAGLGKKFGKIKVYSSAGDQALRISQCYNGELPRIGQAPQTFSAPVRWYNATAVAPRAGLGHGYLASSLEVASDFAAEMNGVPINDARKSLRGLPWLGGVESAWSIDWGNIVGSLACEALRDLP